MGIANNAEDSAKVVSAAADLLLGVAAAKSSAAKLDPGADRSAANARKVERENWKATGSPF